MRTTNDPQRQADWLSVEELAAFQRWFAEFDAAARDRQIAAGAKKLDLDALAARQAATNKAEAAGSRALR